MEKLNLLEKADAYDRVVKEVKDFFDGKTKMPFDVDKTLEYLFPELKVSEDEKIRREILEHCKNQAEPYIQLGCKCAKIQSWIDWLEKQGEQKPAWSEEDEKERNQIITWLEIFKKEFYKKEYQDVMTWLESLKDRFNCKVNCTTTKEWEPSDEQIKAISIARSFITDDFGEHPTLSESLMELEEQLKNLKKPSDNINVAKPNFKA